MANEIVKYGNELNTVVFRKFTANELNLFFSIVSRMRDKGTETVIFTFDELRYLSKYKPTSNKRFMSDLDSTYSKMLQLNYGSRFVTENKLQISRFVLFTGFDIEADIEEGNVVEGSGTVTIAVNPKLKHVLNDLETWTRYSLEDFLDLKSSYAKTMFRLLKQYRTTGKLILSMEEFRELLDVPKSYTTGPIDQKVLGPIVEELTPLFRGLTITKNKSKRRGNRVLGYTFTFQAEDRNANDFKQGSLQQGSLQADTRTPATKGRKAKVEPTPAWFNEDPKADTPLPDEQSKAFNERLRLIRGGKQ